MNVHWGMTKSAQPGGAQSTSQPRCASHYKGFWPCLVCWDLCNAVRLNHFSSGIILNKYFHSHWSRYFNYKYPLNSNHTGEKLFLVILSFFYISFSKMLFDSCQHLLTFYRPSVSWYRWRHWWRSLLLLLEQDALLVPSDVMMTSGHSE